MTIDEEQVVVEEEAIENTEVSEEEVIENTETLEENEPTDAEEEDQEEDRVVIIGDSEPEEEAEEHKEAPEWVKTTRKVNRNLTRENKRLKKQLEAATKPKEEEIVLGPKPTLESSKFDDKQFEKNLLDWHEKSRKVEEQKRKQQETVEAQNKAWQEKQERYVTLQKEHKFKDFNDAEDAVKDAFNAVQQGIIVSGMEDPALVVYALGKNPKQLEELSKITDPVAFAIKLGKLEDKVRTTKRKAPAPEKRVSGGRTGAGSIDRTLDKLREEASRTGDYTEVRKYKQKLKQRSQ